MKKLTIGRLLLFALGCLIIGTFVNFVIVKNIFALQGFMYVTVIVLSIVMCGLVLYLLTFLVIREDKKKNLKNSLGTFTLNRAGLDSLINKINEYLIKIRQLNDYIADRVISGELSEIEKSIYKIQRQLKDEKISERRVQQLEEFFEYYMPLIVKILNSYKRIETNELTGKNAMETRNQIASILPIIKKAFEKELDYMLTDEMLDITTDIKVLESMLSKDGLIDKNNGI